jgi:hypothetical protein
VEKTIQTTQFVPIHALRVGGIRALEDAKCRLEEATIEANITETDSSELLIDPGFGSLTLLLLAHFPCSTLLVSLFLFRLPVSESLTLITYLTKIRVKDRLARRAFRTASHSQPTQQNTKSKAIVPTHILGSHLSYSLVFSSVNSVNSVVDSFASIPREPA